MGTIRGLAWALLCLALASIPARADSTNLLIPADVEWFDTGVVIGPNQRAVISSAGSWTNGGVAVAYAGPQGFAHVIRSDTIIPSTPLAALIGRVGDTMFPVGSYAEVSAQGRLFLIMNDVPNTYGDNIGYMSVMIEIEDCAASGCVPR